MTSIPCPVVAMLSRSACSPDSSFVRAAFESWKPGKRHSTDSRIRGPDRRFFEAFSSTDQPWRSPLATGRDCVVLMLFCTHTTGSGMRQGSSHKTRLWTGIGRTPTLKPGRYAKRRGGAIRSFLHCSSGIAYRTAHGISRHALLVSKDAERRGWIAAQV